jgi:hypothetical protein
LISSYRTGMESLYCIVLLRLLVFQLGLVPRFWFLYSHKLDFSRFGHQRQQQQGFLQETDTERIKGPIPQFTKHLRLGSSSPPGYKASFNPYYLTTNFVSSCGVTEKLFVATDRSGSALKLLESSKRRSKELVFSFKNS